MGRPWIPIEPYLDKLEQAILLGATYQLAAAYAGVSEKTFERWRKHAATAKPGTPLAELRERLHQAEAKAAIGWLMKIEQAATEGDWRAAAYKLEHRYPETYGRNVHRVALPAVGPGLAALLDVVHGLPSQPPSVEQWQADAAALGYEPHGTGGGPW